jgi:hypothetical protein
LGFQGATLAGCLGVSESSLNVNAPNASTPEFDQNDQNLTVNDQVTYFATAKAAAADIATLANPKIAPCLNQFLAVPGNPLTQAIAGQLGKGATVGNIAVTSLPQLPFGQKSGALEMDIPLTYQGITFTAHLGIVGLTKGRSESALMLFSVNGFPSRLEAHLEKVAVQKMAS